MFPTDEPLDELEGGETSGARIIRAQHAPIEPQLAEQRAWIH